MGGLPIVRSTLPVPVQLPFNGSRNPLSSAAAGAAAQNPARIARRHACRRIVKAFSRELMENAAKTLTVPPQSQPIDALQHIKSNDGGNGDQSDDDDERPGVVDAWNAADIHAEKTGDDTRRQEERSERCKPV